MVNNTSKEEKEESIDQATTELRQSPRWKSSTKRLVATVLLVLFLLFLYQIRNLLIPAVISLVVAYLLLPLVDLLHNRTRLSRNLSLTIVYLGIATLLIAIPLITIPPLISQGNNLLNNTPQYLQELGIFLSEPVLMGSFVIPLDDLPIETIYSALSDNLLGIVQAVGPSGFTLFGSLASATLSTVGWLLIILVVSFYIVKDNRALWSSVVEFSPEDYHADLRQMGAEFSGIWNAFLRGQFILGFIVGFVTFVVTFAIGLPNALFLGLLAGVLEFIPNIGPALASIPAILLALFQYESSWLGSQVGPFWFALIVLGLYGLIQRVENVYLVPRVIGRSLHLHPLVVFVGALVGASIAGIFGILLAAPLLASGRLILVYIYRKLLDLGPFDEHGQVQENSKK